MSRRSRRGSRSDTAGQLVLRDVSGKVLHASAPAVTESLRYMLARTHLGDGSDLPGCIGLTSTLRGEGVTFVTRSLALVLTHDTGRRVCIVDLNWQAPSMTGAAGKPLPGVSEVMRGGCTLDEALVATRDPRLTILPTGVASPSERPVLANRPELSGVLGALATGFDHVLVDLPAVRAASESLALADKCGTVALVVAAGATPEAEVRAAVAALSGVTMLGVILNRHTSKVPAFVRRRIPV